MTTSREVGIRVLTGVVFASTFVGALMAGGWVLWGYVLAVLLLVGWEYAHLSDLPRGMEILFLLSLGGIYGFVSAGRMQGAWLFLQCAVLALGMLLLPRWPDLRFETLARSVFGLVYLGLPMAWLVEVVRVSVFDLLAYFIMLWAADTGAYVTGKLMGRRPLHPRVSPGKTVEGFGGRIVWALAAGLGVMQWRAWNGWTFLAAVGVAVFSEMGDLLESIWKREKGVKDSSGLLPGHGGFLDRLDSVFTSLPVFWILWKTLLRG